MLADATLQELSRQTEISVRRSPAAEIPLGQSGLIHSLLRKKAPTPDVYGIDVISPGVLSEDPVGLKAILQFGNVSGGSGSAADLYDPGKTGSSSLPGECWRAFLLRLRRVKDPNGRRSIGIQLDNLTLIGVGVVLVLQSIRGKRGGVPKESAPRPGIDQARNGKEMRGENHMPVPRTNMLGGQTNGQGSPRLDPETKVPDYDALLRGARKGEPGAFERLCEQATPRIYRTLCRITKNREDAEDALQEALMRAFINLPKFGGRSSFSTWLTRIALNAAFMKLRRCRLSREVAIDGPDRFGNEQSSCQFKDRAPSPEEEYAAQEQVQILRGALSGLRPRVRVAVETYQLQERSLKETAELLGISIAATKGRLFQARAALRNGARAKNIGDQRIRRAA